VQAVPVSAVISITLLLLFVCPLRYNIIGLILSALCIYLVLLYHTSLTYPAGSPTSRPDLPDIRQRLVALLMVRAHVIYIQR